MFRMNKTLHFVTTALIAVSMSLPVYAGSTIFDSLEISHDIPKGRYKQTKYDNLLLHPSCEVYYKRPSAKHLHKAFKRDLRSRGYSPIPVDSDEKLTYIMDYMDEPLILDWQGKACHGDCNAKLIPPKKAKKRYKKCLERGDCESKKQFKQRKKAEKKARKAQKKADKRTP